METNFRKNLIKLGGKQGSISIQMIHELFLEVETFRLSPLKSCGESFHVKQVKL